MKKQIKYQIPLAGEDSEVSSVTYLGNGRVGIVYGEFHHEKLSVINIADGSILWEKEIGKAVGGGTCPIYDENAVYVPFAANRSSFAISAHNPQTGEELWQAKVDASSETCFTVPLAQTAEHIFYTNNTTMKFVVLDKKTGKAICTGKLAHQHESYKENIHAWGNNFVTIGRKRNSDKFFLDTYTPEGLSNNFSEFQPKGEVIQAHCVVGDHLFFGTHIGTFYQYDLNIGKIISKHSAGEAGDPKVLSYCYSNMVLLGGHLVCLAEHSYPDTRPSVYHLCKFDLKTNTFSSEPIELGDVEGFLQILSDGTGVYLSKNGVVKYNAMCVEKPAEIVLDGWAEMMTLEKLGMHLCMHEYGTYWIVAEEKLLSIPETEGILFCWEIG